MEAREEHRETATTVNHEYDRMKVETNIYAHSMQANHISIRFWSFALTIYLRVLYLIKFACDFFLFS